MTNKREALKQLDRAYFNWERFDGSVFRMDEPARTTELQQLEAAKQQCRELGITC